MTAQAEKDTQLVKGIREAEIVPLVREDSDGHGRETGCCHRVMVTIMLRAVVLRTKTVGTGKDAGEGLRVTPIAAGTGDGGEGALAVAQQPGGVVQTLPFQRLIRSFAHQRTVSAVPVPRRERCFGGKTVEVNIAIIVAVQIAQGTAEAGFVVSVHADRVGQGGGWFLCFCFVCGKWQR